MFDTVTRPLRLVGEDVFFSRDDESWVHLVPVSYGGR